MVTTAMAVFLSMRVRARSGGMNRVWVIQPIEARAAPHPWLAHPKDHSARQNLSRHERGGSPGVFSQQHISALLLTLCYLIQAVDTGPLT